MVNVTEVKQKLNEMLNSINLGYKPKVVIGISARENMPTVFAAQLIKLRSIYDNIITDMIIDFAQPVDISRNSIFTKFLIDNPYATHIWMLDTDVIVPDDALIHLLAVEKLDRFICSGLLVKKSPPHYPLINSKYGPNTYKPIITWPENVGYLNVDSVGFGCLLIKRRVLQDMPYPFAQSGSHQSEDYFFCERAIAYGYRPAVSLQVKCAHVGSYWYTIEDAKKYLQAEVAGVQAIRDNPSQV
jgi:hypothetical protein